MFKNPDEVVQQLTEEQCWQELNTHEFGRLAFHLADEVTIVPVNYCTDNGALYFRTAEGSKLLGVTMNPDVAFEIDNFLGDTAMSVIVRGRAVEVEGPEKAAAEQLPLRPWVPTAKYSIVKIEVTEVSGRHFDLSKPWEHMRPQS